MVGRGGVEDEGGDGDDNGGGVESRIGHKSKESAETIGLDVSPSHAPLPKVTRWMCLFHIKIASLVKAMRGYINS